MLPVSKPTLYIFSLPHGGGSTRNGCASLIMKRKQYVVIRILLDVIIYTCFPLIEMYPMAYVSMFYNKQLMRN